MSAAYEQAFPNAARVEEARATQQPVQEQASASAARLAQALGDAAARRDAIDAKAAPIAPGPGTTSSALPMVRAAGQPLRTPQTPIPPARIAVTAGDRNPHLDYNSGRSMRTGAPVAVVPVMERAGDSAMPTMEGGLRIRAAREMDFGTASVTLNGIMANLRHWTRDFPHKVTGDAAVFLEAIRQISAHDDARRNAAAYGQTDFKDPAANAVHAPPPESLLLGQLRAQAGAVLTIYEKVLDLTGARLVAPDQAAVDLLKSML